MMNRRRFGQTLLAGAVLPAVSILPAEAIAAPAPDPVSPPLMVDTIEAQMREIETRIGHMRLLTDYIRRVEGHLLARRPVGENLIMAAANNLYSAASAVAMVADEQRSSVTTAFTAVVARRKNRLSEAPPVGRLPGTA